MAVTETRDLSELTGEQRVLADQFMEFFETALLDEGSAGATDEDYPIIAAMGKAQHRLATEIEPEAYPSPGFLAGCTKNVVATFLWEALGGKKGFTRWDKLGIPIPKILEATRRVREKLNVTAK